MAASLGRIAAGQLDEPLLDVALDLDLTRPGGLGLGVQSGRQPLGDETAAHPFDGSPAGVQCRDDVLIGAAQPWRLIGQQKNTRMAKLASGSPAPRDKTF
jgi:hypothetical protein